MKFYTLVILISILSLSFLRRAKNTINQKEIDTIRTEAKKCQTLYCLGSKARSLEPFVKISYVEDKEEFLRLLEQDFNNRGTTISLKDLEERMNKDKYQGFTTIHSEAVIYGKPKTNMIPFSLLHELSHILMGSSGLTPNLRKDTISFNEGFTNLIAKRYAMKNRGEIDTSKLKDIYYEATNALDNIFVMFNIENIASSIIYDSTFRPLFSDTQTTHCLNHFATLSPQDKIKNYSEKFNGCDGGFSSRGFIIFAHTIYEKILIFIEKFSLKKYDTFASFMTSFFKFETFLKSNRFHEFLVQFVGKIIYLLD